MINRYHRWNFEIDDQGEVSVCKNYHDKGHPCEYEPITTKELIDTLQDLSRSVEQLEFDIFKIKQVEKKT